MSVANSHETGIDDLSQYPVGLEDEGNDSQELDLITGDYTSRMEEVLGREDEDEEEDEDFLYQGEDSQEASATYNEQLIGFLEGLDDEAGSAHGDTEEELQVEKELYDKETFVYEEPPRVRAYGSFGPLLQSEPNLCRSKFRLIVRRRPHRCPCPRSVQEILLPSSMVRLQSHRSLLFTLQYLDFDRLFHRRKASAFHQCPVSLTHLLHLLTYLPYLVSRLHPI